MTIDNPSPELVKFIFDLASQGRSDIYAKRMHDGSYTPVYEPLTEAVIINHLKGIQPIGIYLLHKDKVRYGALDIDDHDGKIPPSEMQGWIAKFDDRLRRQNLRPFPVVSGGGRGGHVYVLFRELQSAKTVRLFLKKQVEALGLTVGTKGLAAGQIEIFPKQDAVKDGGLGSLLATPFSRESKPLSEDLLPVEFRDWTPPSLYEIQNKVDLQALLDFEPAHPRKKPENKGRKPPPSNTDPLGQVEAALKFLPADERDTWIRIGHILKYEFGEAGFIPWHKWSTTGGDKYRGEQDCHDTWAGIEPKGDIRLASLYHLARQAGWKGHINLIDCVVSAPELAKLKIPVREQIVEPFLPTSSISMIFAERGLGKTWLAFYLALAVASGRDFLSFAVTRERNVLIIDGEMTLADIQKRLVDLNAIKNDRIMILPSELLFQAGHSLNINNPDHQKLIDDLLVQLERSGRKPDLIILDNISSLGGGIDENDNSALDVQLQWLVSLRHRGFATVMIHHTGKNGEQRGASRREDLLDTSIKLSPIKDHEKAIVGASFTMEFVKTRGEKPMPLSLELFLRENEDGTLDFHFEAHCAVAPKDLTLKTIFDGIRSPQGWRPYKLQDEVADVRKVSKSAISKHMTALRGSNLIATSKGEIRMTQRGMERVRKLFPNDRGGPPDSYVVNVQMTE